MFLPEWNLPCLEMFLWIYIFEMHFFLGRLNISPKLIPLSKLNLSFRKYSIPFIIKKRSLLYY